MPREMFESSAIKTGRKWYMLPLTAMAYVTVILGLLTYSISIGAANLPHVNIDIGDFYMVKLPTVVPQLPSQPKAPKPTDGPTIPTDEPKFLPKDDVPVAGPPMPPGNDIPDGPFIPGPPFAGPPPPEYTPPPPPVVPKPQEPVVVGGNIRQPSLVRHVNPVYPTMAYNARVQGIVIIEATLSPDGRVENARILRSVPLLDQAALDAVRQWQYAPTLLNGKPVPVLMTVTVHFTLK